MAIEVMAKMSVDTSQAEASISTIAQKEQEIENRKMSLAVDASGALTAVEGVVQKVEGALSGIKLPSLEGKNIKIGADTSQALGAVEGVKTEAESIKHLPAKIEVNEKEAESKLEGFKEQAKGALGSLGGGVLAGGAALGAEQLIDAGKEELKSQEDLKIALANTGVAGAALNARFDETDKKAHQLAESYGQPIDKMRELETEVANFGGITGKQADKVTQIGVAMEQFGLSSRALRGIIAGAADPEAQQALETLKTKIGGLGTAFESAKTPGEKLDAIYARMTPTLKQMQESAKGPLGQMANLDNSMKELEGTVGTLVIKVLGPFIPLLTTIANIAQTVLVPALDPVAQIFQALEPLITGVANILGTVLKNQLQAVAEAIKGVAGIIDGAIHLDFGKMGEGLKDVGKGVVDSVVAPVKSANDVYHQFTGDATKGLDDQKDAATAAGSAATDAANQAAGAQQNLQQSIDAANSSFKDQQKAAKDELNAGKIAYERQAEYIRTGYADGQKLSEAQIEAYKNANVKLLAQAREMQDEQKKIKADGDTFLGTKTKASKSKSGDDPVERAKQLATQTAAELEYQLKLAEASKGQQLTDEDKLAVAERYLSTLNKTLDAETNIDAKKKAAAVGQGETKVTSASNDLTVKAAQDAYAAKKKLADDEAAYEKATEQKIADLRIAVMSDGADKELAIRKAQYDKDVKFAADAAAQGRALSQSETQLLALYDEQYASDVAKIKQKYAKQTVDYTQALEKSAVTGLESVLTAELNAKRSFDLLAYNDKKLSLDKEQTALKASLQKGEISYQEYNLKIQELTQQRVDLENQKVQARWQTEEKLAEQAYSAISNDMQKYLQSYLELGAAQLSGDQKGEQSALDKANATMIGAVANVIQGWTGSVPIVGAALGLAAGLALMEGFKAVEHGLGFAYGGIGMPTLVGERGPEVIAPMKDFSQMSVQLVQSTAQAVARSLSHDQPGQRQGGRHQFNVKVTGQSRTAGRDLVTTYQNESIAQRREQLLPS